MVATRCPQCPGTHNCVAGDGPECPNLFFLFEAPGPTEDKRGLPLMGKTGDEVNRGYLPILGLTRPKVRIDNAISCLPPGPEGKLDPKRQKDLDLLQSCSEHHVYPYLERVQPKLIVPCGSFACRSIDPSINLELQHGIPTNTPWGMSFPMYHPAGGIHEPKKMLLIRTDWTRLRKHLTGRLRMPKDPHISPWYEEIESCKQLDSILAGCNDYIMACDTEVKRGGDPFCLTFSIQEGTGFLVRASRYDILDRFQHYLNNWHNHILFHNWMFDAQVVYKMGLKFAKKWIKDTMVTVFELGNLPQGLKALAFRELGMQMEDFDDLVTPYAKPLVLEYYREIWNGSWPKPNPVMEREKDGHWRVKQPQGMNTKIKRFFTDLQKNPDKDLFTSWANWDEAHEMLQKELGPWPGKCITYAPMEKVIFYACRDADATLRLWPLLKHMRRYVRRKPQEHWGDGIAA